MNRDVHEPFADSIETVIYLVGDAGEATRDASPILRRLRDEVEQWSSSIGRDRAVMVLYLGDNVYPVGLRDATDPAYPQDSTHLQSQLDVVSGPNAIRHGARAVFIPGNHDWGHKPGEPGVARVRNQQNFIERRSRGFHAVMLPDAGTTGPATLDVGGYLRLLLIDTSWWLLHADRNEKTQFVGRLERSLSSRGTRSVVIAAHHPWASGSEHGGLVPFWKGIGIKWLLARSGASLQDLNSLPYRDLKTQLRNAFTRHGPPLLMVGGHDHALQVIKATDATEPQYSAVSGSGSKSSAVGPTDGSVFRRAEPGFMRLVVLKNRAVDLFVVSANPDFRDCGDRSVEALRLQCLEVGAREFRTTFSVRIQEPALAAGSRDSH